MTIGAVGIPALAGLANQFGVAALAGGTAIMAFQGVGDALKAVNEAKLNPTLENLQKANEELSKLSPHAQAMVMRLQELRPVLAAIRSEAQAGLFPGIVASIDELQDRADEVEQIFGNIGRATGDMLAEGAESLASERWTPFFDFMANEAPSTLTSLGRTVGSLTHGLAELWMAFDPLNDDFSNWLLDTAQGFDSWAEGIDQTQGFTEFIDYVRTNGPQVADTAGALADAVLEIAEAAAPLGGPVLQGVESLARILASIADSDLGTPIMGAVTALALYSRAAKLAGAATQTAWGGQAKASLQGFVSSLTTVTTAQERAATATGQLTRRQQEFRSGLATIGKGAALMGGLAIASTGAADGIGLSNTASLALMGTLGGPWGVAAGAAVGLTMDLAAANDDWVESLEHAQQMLADSPTAFTANQDALTGLRESYSAMQDDLEGTGDFWADFGRGLQPDAIKNGIEDIFGDSDVDEARAALEAYEAQVADTQQAASDLANAVRGDGEWVDYTQNLSDLERVAGSLQPAMDGIGLSFEQLADADPRLFDIYVAGIQDFIAQADSVPGRTWDVAEAIKGLDDEMLGTVEGAEALKNALDALLTPNLALEEATSAWRESLVQLREGLNADFSFSGVFAQGRENQELTRNALQAIQDRLVAMAQVSTTSAGDLARALRESREEFIANGVAAGFSRQEIVKRANAIGLTPKLLRTVFQTVGIDEMVFKARGIADQLEKLPKQVQVQLRNAGYDLTKGQIDTLQKEYDLTPKQVETILRAQDNASPVITEVDRRATALDRKSPHVDITASANTASAEYALNQVARDRSSTIFATVRQIGGPQNAPVADGGLFRRDRGQLLQTFAAGGFAGRIGNQPPQIRPYTGPNGILWSEEGSGPWEAFISGHPAKIDRSRTIADEVVSRLGGQIQWMADGGLVQRHRVPSNVVATQRTGRPVSVVVGGPQVRVFIDGDEVRAVVDARVSDHRAHDAWRGPSYQGVDVD